MIKCVPFLILLCGCTFNVSFKWERMNPKPVSLHPNVGTAPAHAAAFEMEQKYLMQKMAEATNKTVKMPSRLRTPKGKTP